MQPSLSALSLTDDALRSGDHMLAVGQTSMALLDRSGRLAASAALRDAPVAKPVVEDVDGDDVHDVVLLSRRGVDVYLLRRSNLHQCVQAALGRGVGVTPCPASRPDPELWLPSSASLWPWSPPPPSPSWAARPSTGASDSATSAAQSRA